MPRHWPKDNAFLIPYLIAEGTVSETQKDLERARSIAVALESECAEKDAVISELRSQIQQVREVMNHALHREGTHAGCIEASDVQLIIDAIPPEEIEKELASLNN